ncbi:MAG: F510_1955 family glycosylhydrolase [Aeromicrobium sp.]
MFTSITPHRAGAIAALLTILATAACAPTMPADDDTDEVFQHIHGLAVNPADQQLYIATHEGVYRSGRSFERVGPKQDTMGFVGAGSDRFLASGHPAVLNRPNPLGLIESRNGARTWQPIAFSGQSDFHALDVSGSWTFAYDADKGELLRSRDRKEWQSLARDELIDIAANPRDPNWVLATTATGQLLEIEVGSDPRPIADSPRMGFIDFETDTKVVGLGGNGEVHLSHDPGRPWKRVAKLSGMSQAVVAGADRWFAATTSGVFSTDDEGSTWQTIYPEK